MSKICKLHNYIMHMLRYINELLFWSAPLQILLSIFFLWRLFGIAVFMGVFVLIALIPLNTRLSMIMRNFQV